MSNFIYASDNSINTNREGYDEDVWYFTLPDLFHGWQGIVYGGEFQFTLSSFAGDFSEDKRNMPDKLNLVEITCAECALTQGITIGFPLRAIGPFNGRTASYALTMTESSGWLKDPKNTLHAWKAPTKCEFIQVLSGISSIRILGDFTTWYECVIIDNVRFVGKEPTGRWQVPICAQDRPDARMCSCKNSKLLIQQDL
mmetsp:Transcript_9945/g.14069  ORF Transcript_9945/g.14069 Transcript_9945/m.14069 type:complete len:198 (+) Transcript_9945:722-1315(+)